MPSFSKSLDVQQGYNYKKDVVTPVGFLTKLKIGTDEYKVDQTCKDPLDPTKDLKVVGVLSSFSWDLGTTDSLYFSGQMTTENRCTLATALINNLTNLDVELEYTVYEYDPLAKKYFKSSDFGSSTLKGLVEKSGANLNLQISDEPAPQVQSPQNFTFNVGVKPQPTAQTINLAVSDTKKIVKSWGVAAD